MANEGQAPATGLAPGQPPPYTVLAPTAGIVKDHIYITEGGELRTIAVSTSIPEAMARQGQWRVEDFDLHKELYRGKTSLLYMATDRRSGIQVALKLYRKRKLSTLNRYQVEREIRIHIQLDHVNIIKLFAAFEDEKNVYMVQEFAGGGDLFEDLKRNGGTIKEKYTVRDIVVPFLNALQYLHGLGIIHRDIKPENILLTSQRVIKIADFGLSIAYTQERPVTRAGTLDYMAPEVLICPDKRRPEENKDKVLLAYTAQVDAWAVGILCYELMVGYPPFEQESRAATYEHIMYKEPKFPAWMSEDAKKFISTALCKNATQRPTITDLGKQPLVLTYAKPVDKPPEQRAPQEFLVELSARSVLTPPPPAAIATSSNVSSSSVANVHKLGIKRPGALETDECGSNSSLDSPKSMLSPTANKASNNSSMIMDEDASYSITDFATTDDASYFGVSHGNGSTSPTKSGQQSQPPITRIPSNSMRGMASPLAKSRLSGVSHGGAAPAGLSLPQGKASPLVRPSPLASPAGVSTSSEQLMVESSSNSYYKPQSGILSDDSAVPGARNNSGSGAAPGLAAQAGTSVRPPMAAGSKGGIMERPPLDKLLATGTEEQTQGDGQSKYSKLFAKMWGSKPADSKPAQSDGSFTKSGLGGKPLKNGMRTLQEELLAERADSLVVMDSRTGSVVGAPAMNFKKPSQAALQARSAVEAAAAAAAASEKPDKLRDVKTSLFAGSRAAALLSDESGPQRMNSEALLARVGVSAATSSGRSFTSPNSPTMKKLANAPIVNKIHEYVSQNHGE